MIRKMTADPVRRIFLVWALGIISIVLLLGWGPADAFMPKAETAHEEEELLESGDELTDGKASDDDTADDDTANDNRKLSDRKERTDDRDELSSDKKSKEPVRKASAWQIIEICAAMTIMLCVGLFFWGSASPAAAAYITAIYVITALPMLRGQFFALSIMIDHAAWMLWVFRMPRLRNQIRNVGTKEEKRPDGRRELHFNGYEYFLIVFNSFLIVSGICLLRYYGGVENLDFVTYLRPAVYVTGLVGTAHILYLIRLFRGNRYTTSRLLIAGAVFFAFSCIMNKQDLYYAAGLVLLLAFLIWYLVKDEPGMLDFMDRRDKSAKDSSVMYRRRLYAVIILAIIPAAYFSALSVARYRTFHASNFDLGIFAQMYEYMARTGLPVTTVERGYLLSHLYVHFSPVYYLFLPVYMIFRSVESLLVIQAVMVFAGVVPLFLICRHYRLKPLITFLVSCVYLLFPAIGQPLLFDFHENKFIPFFVLWFIYFYLEKKDIPALVFLVLSLFIKEDTPIFLMVFALYRIIGKKDYKRGGILLAVSAVYFAAVMLFIGSHGQGLVEGHYSMYYLEGESGLAALARNILLEPGRVLAQVFDRENLGYIFCTLGVLLFVPLLCRDKRRLILLIPYVAFCLMTAYPSQHDVGYQYTYGPAVLLLLLFIMNLSELERSTQYVVCLTALCAALIMSYAYRGEYSYRYFTEWYENRDEIAEADELIAGIPSGASVTADGLIVPHLSKQQELYEYDNEELYETDYYLLRKGIRYPRFSRNYREMGYEYKGTTGNIRVYLLRHCT
ncbi:MAG: DUF2079 domain-containing protein [Blautia sp.]|nr:DUF2079 domain-containing protein [Blautia sp.]